MRPRTRLLLAAFAAAALAPAVARAEEPKPDAAVEDEVDPEAGVPRPYAADWRTGHVLLSGRVALLSPTGNAADVGNDELSVGLPERNLAGVGILVGGTLGVGVTRHGVLEGSAEYGFLGAPIDCATCFGRQFAVALGFSYHLAQGIALDPWVSYGVGFRFSEYRADNFLTSKIQKQTFRGVDIARLAFGAEFFALPFAGLGPYLEADIGTNVKFPQADYGGSVYAIFQLGARLTFDPMRASTRSRPRAASAPLSLGF